MHYAACKPTKQLSQEHARLSERVRSFCASRLTEMFMPQGDLSVTFNPCELMVLRAVRGAGSFITCHLANSLAIQME